ncbi:MAG: amidase [Woeseia sp.]
MKYLIILATAVTLLASDCAYETAPDYDEYEINALQTLMQQGDLTARGLVESYLRAIDRRDRSGPALNSIIELNPDALAIADALDRERQASGPRGPLHGIPVVLKANIDTGDSMSTTAGSLALNGHRSPDDAFLVKALRESGAIILGKANLSEWANFRSKDSSSGWSSLGGQTRNPYDLARNPCGSSSGSAVAVAANLTTLAVGTETNGSIICPAAINGIVGIKPSLGLVSRDGIIPIAHSQDTAGPMARTVRDAAMLLGAMVARDTADPASASRPANLPDYAEGLSKDALAGKRIGVLRSYFGAGRDARVEKVLADSVEMLKSGGASIVDPVEIDISGLGDERYQVLLYEFKTDLAAYLESSNARFENLEQIIEFNTANAGTVMPIFGQDIMEDAQAKGPLTETGYIEALEKIQRITRDGIDNALGEHALDALIAPSNGPAWMTDHVLGDVAYGVGSSTFAAVSGYANITVPAGFVSGLPIGVSFIGGAFSEKTLIDIAYAFEQASTARRPPPLE